MARFVESIWYGPRGPLSWILRPFALIFRCVVAVRRWAYQRGWFDSGLAGAPVLVIGNISVGGTGKTPLVEFVANQAIAMGRRPAIVSRGYGGDPPPTPAQVPRSADPAIFGDEPVLLADRCDCPVWVDVNRLRAARAAVQQGANLVICDDGLQHYRLRRDAEIAVLDGARQLGNGLLLPAGPLREPAERLKSVSLVVVNDPGQVADYPGFQLVPGPLKSQVGGEERPLESLRGTRVLAVAGIGNPDRFLAQLEHAGIRITAVPVPDHGRVDLPALTSQGIPIIMTEKDAIKYKYLNNISKEIYYMPVDLKPDPILRNALDQLLLDLADGASPDAT